MRFRGIIILAAAGLLAGCGGREPEQAVRIGAKTELPEDLQPLQGEWAGAAGEGRLCIDGRTVRLVFTSEDTGRVYRRNVFIEEVDAAAHRLEMRGETEPWHYGVQQHGLEESIMFRFYDHDNHRWTGSVMTRRVEGLVGL